MKAMLYHQYGSPDVLKLAEVEKPRPEADEVLIKVHAVSLNRHSQMNAYLFTVGAPELNPTEWLWTQVGEYTANMAPYNRVELSRNVRAGLARTRQSQRRLWACIYASELPGNR